MNIATHILDWIYAKDYRTWGAHFCLAFGAAFLGGLPGAAFAAGGYLAHEQVDELVLLTLEGRASVWHWSRDRIGDLAGAALGIIVGLVLR